MKGIYWILLVISVISCNSSKKSDNIEKHDDAEKIALLTRTLNEMNLLHKDKHVCIKALYDTNHCSEIELTLIELDSIPDEINKFSHLNSLKFDNCYLSTLKGLHLSRIFCLDLIRNKFTSIPPASSFPKNLGMLYMQANRLSGTLNIDTVPGNLFWMDLSYNKITNIIFKHPRSDTSISELTLNGNNIMELDSSIYLLPKLTNLSILNNPIKIINIRKFKALTYIAVDKDYTFSDSDKTYIKRHKIDIQEQ